MPDITVYMNCDTRLAINLSVFGLGKYDEFIFTIKNYDYIDSSYVFLYRARATDIDENGEILFKIDPDISKRIKPGAFYNFALLVNAYDKYKPTEYKKLTENGRVNIEYGAHDLALPDPEEPIALYSDFSDVHLERLSDDAVLSSGNASGIIVDIDIEEHK
jgi:hypothetical protein